MSSIKDDVFEGQHEKCTGCQACFNICPQKAIIMEEDIFGYIYPQIDKEKCTGCNLCRKICPSINNVELKRPKCVYAIYAKQNEKRMESSSGGVATLFYEYILKQHGVIYGANNITNGKFEFIRIDNEKQLYKVKQSKYVHCYINRTYEMVKQDLINNKKVMFIGTPCQVSGLKAYLTKEYDNLYTADLVCHGVPSQKLVAEQVKYDYNLNMNCIDKISFRNKCDFTMNAYKNNEMLKKRKKNNYYMTQFSNCNIFRDNCYNCKYANTNRVSDVTVGDFWGLDESAPIYDDMKKGISVVLPMTEKGIELIKGIRQYINIEERTIEEAIEENEQLRQPATKKKEYYKFRKFYPKYGYVKTMKKLIDKKQIIKNKLKSNKMIYKVYKILKELKHKI